MTERIGVMNTELEGTRFKKTVPQCSTCMSPYRAVIETWFSNRMRAKDIIVRLETRQGHGIGISERGLRRHFERGHCNDHRAMLMRETWAKAAELGIDIDQYEETQEEEVFAVQLTVKKFREQLTEDWFKPDFKDGLAASKLLHEMKKSLKDEAYDPNDMFVAISILMSHVNTIINRYASQEAREAMAHFSRLLESDPILQDLVAKTRETQGIHDDVDDYFGEDEVDDVPQLLESNLVDAEVVTVIESDSFFTEESDGWNEPDDDETL